MTISNTSRVAGPFLGNGVVAAFPFTFKVFTAADLLAVQVNVASGILTTLNLGADYNVTLSADQNASPGGTLTLNTPLAVGNDLSITSNIAPVQPLDLTNQGGFYPKVINDALDRIVIYIQQVVGSVSRSIKFPLSDTASRDLPPVALRANNLLGFDSSGNPVAVAPSAQSATALQAALAQAYGSSLIGFVSSGLGAVFRTIQDKLRDNVNVRDFGALGDGSDATAAFAKASAYGNVRVPAGVYVIDTVYISKTITFECEPGAVFRRKPGADGSSYGYNRMSGMFTVNANGVTLRFTGAMTFDGNYQNQTAVEPGGCAVFVTVPASVTADPISLYIENGNFINGTSEYLLIRGDDIRHRYRVDVELVSPTFSAGVYGIGRGDPSTPTALGFLPTYVHILDYVVLRTYDLKASFLRPLSLGNYAAVAVWGSFAGSDYTQAGNASILMYGRTEIDSCGRASWKYNDQTNFTTNNGIGAIDGYGNVDEIYVEDIYARNTQYSAVRAKGSCRAYTVQHADFQGCWRGLEVSPSSTGPCETVVHVGKITARDGTIPQLYFVGSSATDQLYSVDIDSAYLFGTQTNPEALVNQGNVMLRNTAKATVRALSVIGSPSNGIAIDTIDRTHIGELIANNNAGNALRVSGTGQFILDKFDIRNCTTQAIWILAGMVEVTIRGGKIDTAVDYGVFNQATGNAHIQNVTVTNISGQSRGFYNAGGNVTMLTNIAGAGVTTPLFYIAGVALRELQNSWNPREVQGNFTQTTQGTWNQGDKVWNTAPSAGGPPGWVCVASGSPGIFKAMANLAA